MTYDVRPLTVLFMLLIYASLFVVIRTYRSSIGREESKTFWVVGLLWAVLVFGANILLERLGAMSHLPLVNNFLHTFVWIGLCLTWLYLGVRDKHPIWVQFMLFFVFSLAVKVAEQTVFGTWDHGHFFMINGNAAYVIGWSLADGLYPLITRFGLRLLSRVFSGLVLV